MALVQFSESPSQAADTFAGFLEARYCSARRRLIRLGNKLPDVRDPSSADGWVASFGDATVRPFAVPAATFETDNAFREITFVQGRWPTSME
jgi:hypothetical protein